MSNSPGHETQGASLASNMKHLRKEASLSQEQLSERSGVPRSTIASLERGEGNPTLQVLMGVARGLGVTIAELLAQRKANATLYKREEHGRLEYQVSHLNSAASSAALAEMRRLTPAQSRYLTIEEIILSGTEVAVASPHPQGTEEFFFVVSGSCYVEIAGESFHVNEGDLLRFDGSQLHSYRGLGDGRRTTAYAIVVQSPRL
jgi:XRE family transcriptional regulator, regulator of sulfur utilization